MEHACASYPGRRCGAGVDVVGDEDVKPGLDLPALVQVECAAGALQNGKLDVNLPKAGRYSLASALSDSCTKTGVNSAPL